MTIMFHQIKDINKDLNLPKKKKKHNKNPGIKNYNKRNEKKNYWSASIADLNWQKNQQT